MTADVAGMKRSVQRINWGIIFNKVGTVLNGITKYRHTFAVTIPRMEYTPLRDMICDTQELVDFHCASVNKLVGQVNEEYSQIYDGVTLEINTLLDIIENIDDIHLPPSSANRVRRSSLDEITAKFSSPDNSERGLPKVHALRYPMRSNTNRNEHRYKRSSPDQVAPHLSPSFCKDGTQTSGGGGLLHSIGTAVSDLIGLPTDEDIKIVDKHICELADVADLNRREMVISQERLSSISAAINNRATALQNGIIHINDRISDTQEQLINVSREIYDSQYQLQNRISKMFAAQNAMYLFVWHLSSFRETLDTNLRYAENWTSGIRRLLSGYIPEELITIDDVRFVIDHVRTVVLRDHPHLMLVHPNPAFYFRVRSTVYSRSDNYTFITLEVPLQSAGGLLGVYRVDRTYIATAQHHNSSTRIMNLPDYFAITPDLKYYTALSTAHYSSCRGDEIRVCQTERSLQKSAHMTCAAALFFDRSPAIMSKCEIQYEHRSMPSEAILLEDHNYLIHTEHAGPEITWTLHCPYARKIAMTDQFIRQVPSCNSCIIRVPCECSLDGNDFYISLQLTDCPVSDRPSFPEITKLYTINLPLLTAMYDPNELLAYSGDSTFSRPLGIERINITIDDADWPEVVSSRDRYNLDFLRLMAQHNKSTTVYSDKAKYFLHKAMDFNDLNMAHINDLEKQFGGNLWREFLSPMSTIGGMSTTVILSVSALIMSIYNCWQKR